MSKPRTINLINVIINYNTFSQRIKCNTDNKPSSLRPQVTCLRQSFNVGISGSKCQKGINVGDSDLFWKYWRSGVVFKKLHRFRVFTSGICNVCLKPIL